MNSSRSTHQRSDAPGWSLLVRRAAAYLIDIALLFLLLAPLGWLIQQAFDITPTTGRQIWATLLVNFSLPTWLYFAIADASAHGATLGKRWLRLRVVRADDGPITPGRALGRTAVKLLPWELVHIAVFAMDDGSAQLGTTQMLALTCANALAIVYFAYAAITRGRRSVHDLIAGTIVTGNE